MKKAVFAQLNLHNIHRSVLAMRDSNAVGKAIQTGT
jgi:hypothetical protein